ncbi:MAG: hypothetical protein QM784_24715 [Polyangiaceae bacterium]
MRLRNARPLLTVLGISCILSACGGSASETPEPERPDAWQLKLRHATRAKLVEQSEAENELHLRELDRTEPARSTWGAPQRRKAEPSLAPLPAAEPPTPEDFDR